MLLQVKNSDAFIRRVATTAHLRTTDQRHSSLCLSRLFTCSAAAAATATDRLLRGWLAAGVVLPPATTAALVVVVPAAVYLSPFFGVIKIAFRTRACSDHSYVQLLST